MGLHLYKTIKSSPYAVPCTLQGNGFINFCVFFKRFSFVYKNINTYFSLSIWVQHIYYHSPFFSIWHYMLGIFQSGFFWNILFYSYIIFYCMDMHKIFNKGSCFISNLNQLYVAKWMPHRIFSTNICRCTQNKQLFSAQWSTDMNFCPCELVIR